MLSAYQTRLNTLCRAALAALELADREQDPSFWMSNLDDFAAEVMA